VIYRTVNRDACHEFSLESDPMTYTSPSLSPTTLPHPLGDHHWWETFRRAVVAHGVHLTLLSPLDWRVARRLRDQAVSPWAAAAEVAVPLQSQRATT
jgi:hypothetical protein